MIRSFLRSVAHFVVAALLLALGVCAVEVGLRCWRIKHALDGDETLASDFAWTTPSPASWIDVAPLLDRQWLPNSDTAVRVVTNQQGLRRHEAVVVPKPRGVVRILCLGSDAVFGSELEEAQTLPARLHEHLAAHLPRNIEVINAGCPRAGPLVHFLRYRHHLSTLQPDIVLLCLAEEDLRYDDQVRGHIRLDPSGRPAFAPHPSIDSEGNRLADELHREFALVSWLSSWAADATGLGQGGNRLLAPDQESDSHMPALAPVAPLQELVSSGWGVLAISLAPTLWSQRAAPENPAAGGEALERDLRRMLQQLQLTDRVPVDNSVRSFRHFGESADLYSPRSGRLSARGTNLYAQRLMEFLSRTALATTGRESQPAPPPSLEPIPPMAGAPDRSGRRPREQLPAGRF